MATVRRIAIDANHPGGWYPDNPEFQGTQYFRLLFSGPYYKLHLPTPIAVRTVNATNDTINERNAVSDVYVWAAGFISFETPTAEQIAFAAQYAAGAKSILEFPGSGGAQDLISSGLPNQTLDSFYFQQSAYGYYITWGDPIEDATLGDLQSQNAGEVVLYFNGEFTVDTGGDSLTDYVRAYRVEGDGFVDASGYLSDVNETGGAGNDLIAGAAGSYEYNYDILRGLAGEDYFIYGKGGAWIEGGRGVDLVQITASDPFTHYDDVPMTVDLALGTASRVYGTATLIGIERVITGGGNDTLRAGDRFGNGADIEKPRQVRNSEALTALSLDGRFGLGSDSEIANATTVPHATVVATGSGYKEFYAITVTQPGAMLTLDIDHASFDTEVALLDASGAVIASNDDAPLDPGSSSTLESFLAYAISAPGDYLIRVTQYLGQAVPENGTYTLNVSLEGARNVAISYDLYGNGGDDLLISGTGDDYLNGSQGFDTASYAEASGGVAVDLTTGLATGHGTDTLSNIDAVIGSAFDDQIAGDSYDNQFEGHAGNDVLTGGGGADTLDGEDGRDWLIGGTGADIEGGGDGHDSVWGGDGDDFLFGGPGDDTIVGNAGIDTAVYAGASGAVWVDLSFIESQDTHGAGWDTLFQVENLIGSSFADQLTGNAGANSLTGAGGADILTGNGGNDRFIFTALGDSTVAAPDTITDFGPGDRIDLHGIDANTALGGYQPFHLGATAGHAGDIVLAYDAGSNRTSVSLYVNGDTVADAVIFLAGSHLGLGTADFVL